MVKASLNRIDSNSKLEESTIGWEEDDDVKGARNVGIIIMRLGI